MTDINALLAFIETLRDREPMCRDCADEDGTCPNRKWPCGIDESDLKALALRYKAYEAALEKADDLLKVCCPVSECLSGYLQYENLPVDTAGATQMHQQFTEKIRALAVAQKALNGGE